MKSNDISAIVDQLCSIYDQSVANLRDALAAYCEQGQASRSHRASRRRVRLSRASRHLFGRADRRAPDPRIRPTDATRHLCLQHRPAGAVPRLSSDAARASDHRLWGRHLRRPEPQRDPLSLCARRKRHQSRQGDRRGAVALVPVERARPYRRRDRRRRVGLFGARRAALGPVRRAAHRLQPCASTALYGHGRRGFPALRPVHELRPLCGRVRPLRRVGASPRGQSLHRAVGPGRSLRARGSDQRGGADRRRHVAAAPDAGLSPDRGRTRRHHSRQHRRRARPTRRRSAIMSRCSGRRSG